MSDQQNPTVLIGLGNPLMSDEGVGVRLIAEIKARREPPSGVEVLDLGTAGMGILHAISGRHRAIFIDCALMGEEPGTIRRFTPDDVSSHKIRTTLSLHEGDLLQTLELAKRIDDSPEEIVILGIEPALIAPGLELSPCVESRLEDYLDLLMTELSAE